MALVAYGLLSGGVDGEAQLSSVFWIKKRFETGDNFFRDVETKHVNRRTKERNEEKKPAIKFKDIFNVWKGSMSSTGMASHNIIL